MIEPGISTDIKIITKDNKEYVEEDVLKTTIKEYESYRNLKLFCNLAWAKCNNNNDFIFMINGKRGTGKSTTGVQILRYYLIKFLKEKFNSRTLRDHMICNTDLLADAVYNLPDKHPIIIDEAVLAAYVGDFAHRNVKELIKLFTVCRTKNRAVGIVTPEFNDVVFRMRNYCIYRIRMISRGLGVLYCRDDSEGGSSDPYHLTELKKIEGIYDSTGANMSVIKRLRRHPCFKDVIRVPALNKNVQRWYDEYREEFIKEELIGSFNVNERLGAVYYNIRKHWNELIRQNRLTQKYFNDKLCVHPVNKINFSHNIGAVLSKFKNEFERLKQLQRAEKESQQAIKLKEMQESKSSEELV